MKQISVMIVDDHRMFREGIISLLEKEDDINVVAEAANSMEIMDSLSKHSIDVVLMDIEIGDISGIEASEIISRQFPDVKILTLSMHSDHNYIIKMLEAGAKGYILKNTGKEEMIRAIKSVAIGDSYFSNEVSRKLIKHLKDGYSSKSTKKRDDIPLTSREIEVLKLIAQEYSNPEIAEKLYISIRTVDTHRRNLLEKLGVKNTAGLVKYAMSKTLTDE